MKRKLIQQMRNEWRNNLWMGIELFIVGIVLWAIFIVFAFIARLHEPPVCFDLTDIYYGNISTIDPEASTYTEYPDSLHDQWTDLDVLMNRLRDNPYVESLGTGNNALPYSYDFSGNELAANIDGHRQIYNGNLRDMSPDLIRTIRLTGLNSETPEELAQMLSDGKTIISLTDAEDMDCTPEQWRGREVFWNYDSTHIEHIGAIIHGFRRSDYEPMFRGVIIRNQHWFPSQIVFRVKPGMGSRFMESLSAADLETGNVYIYGLQSIEQRREVAHLNISTTIRNLTAGAIFVMLVVFLGFLGSFWYKTQQRIPELALRRVNGATGADLLRRLLGEGMMLLVFAAVPAAAIGAFAIISIDPEAEVGFSVPGWYYWATFAAAIGALALMIAAGIWFPASKAMKINPAEALKDQ